MLTKKNSYDVGMLQKMDLSQIKEHEIKNIFDDYISQYKGGFQNKFQQRYFEIFEQGLLSDLDRKSIEPIALTYMNEKDVRGFQHFFSRSEWTDEKLLKRHQELMAEGISLPDGFLSVDGSDFGKKGKKSIGVARQHCGRLGKTETVKLVYFCCLRLRS